MSKAKKKLRVWTKNSLGQYVTAGIPGYVIYRDGGWWYYNKTGFLPVVMTGAYDTREQAQARAIEIHVR